MSKRDQARYLKREAGRAKHELLRILHEMELTGLKSEAQKLERIIIKLERWQQ